MFIKKLWRFMIGRPEKPLSESSWFIRGLWELRSLAFIFGITFFVIQPFVIAAYDTPTGSMEPAIMTNTRYIALPSIYGGFFRFTRIKLPGWKKIQRGDIVIFKYPVDERQNFVKRVIGLPGEKVQIKERAVYINGKALYEPYAYFSEAESAYATENRTDPGHHFGPVTVPQNQLFVLGDNRDNSYDSRYWGFVPLKNVFGTPLFSYWSFDNKRHRIRMGEIFKTIQ